MNETNGYIDAFGTVIFVFLFRFLMWRGRARRSIRTIPMQLWLDTFFSLKWMGCGDGDLDGRGRGGRGGVMDITRCLDHDSVIYSIYSTGKARPLLQTCRTGDVVCRRASM
jgi:hypothetical protein